MFWKTSWIHGTPYHKYGMVIMIQAFNNLKEGATTIENITKKKYFSE